MQSIDADKDGKFLKLFNTFYDDSCTGNGNINERDPINEIPTGRNQEDEIVGEEIENQNQQEESSLSHRNNKKDPSWYGEPRN